MSTLLAERAGATELIQHHLSSLAARGWAMDEHVRYEGK
jgi:hypothetical protein